MAEAWAMAELTHSAVAQICGIESCQNRTFLIVESLAGGTLRYASPEVVSDRPAEPTKSGRSALCRARWPWANIVSSAEASWN